MKESLKQLVIDTATNYIYLALAIDGVEVESIYEEGINNHSVTILPFLEELLKKQNLELQDIDQVIIGVGPGSYTGVRIGVTVAKMIGYLNNVEVMTISSLALMASSSDYDFVLPLIDARRNNAFMALYQNQSNKLFLIKEDCLENIALFKDSIEYDYQVITEGKPNIEKILKSNLLCQVRDIHSLTPNYLRITEAERNLNHETFNQKTS